MADARYRGDVIFVATPKGLAADHVHRQAEHVYYFLKGRGLLTLDGAPHLVEPGVAAWIPPGVRHQLENTGVEDLLFVVVTTPAGELPLGEASPGVSGR